MLCYFNFLTVAQFGPRKNVPNTIKWFVEEFHDEEVGLIVKSNIAKNCIIDREKLYSDMSDFLKDFQPYDDCVPPGVRLPKIEIEFLLL